MKILRFKADHFILFSMPFIIFLGPSMPIFGSFLSQVFYFFLTLFVIFRLNFKLNYIYFFLFYILLSIVVILIHIPTDYFLMDSLTANFNWLIGGLSITLSLSILLYNNYLFYKFIRYLFFLYILILALGIIQLLTGDNFISTYFDSRVNYLGFFFPTSFFTNPNDLSYFIILIYPIIFLFLINNKNYITSFLITIVSFFLVINTESYLSFLYIILYLFFLIIIYLIFLVSNFKKNSLNIVQILKTFFLLLLFFLVFRFLTSGFPFFSQFISTISLSIDTIFTFNLNNPIIGGRISIITENFYKFLSSNFLIGSGPGSSIYFTGYPLHNFFLTLLFEYGILVFISFLVFLLQILFYLFKVIHRFKGYQFAFILNFIIFIFLLPVSTSVISEGIQRKSLWIILGLILGFINNKFFETEVRKV